MHTVIFEKLRGVRFTKASQRRRRLFHDEISKHMHCNRKGAVFQQSKCQDSVGRVSSMESSDLQLKYGKPEGTFENAVIAKSLVIVMRRSAVLRQKRLILLRHDAIRITLYLTSLRTIKKILMQHF